MKPAKIREEVKKLAVHLAKAAQTGSDFVLLATETAFDLRLAELIPDNPEPESQAKPD